MVAYLTMNRMLSCARAKVTFCICFILAGLSGICIMMVSNGDDDQVSSAFIVLVILARFGLAANFNLVYIQHAKMFPILFTVTSLGISNIVCRMSVALAPLVAEVRDPYPMAIFTSLAFLTAVASLFLREEH